MTNINEPVFTPEEVLAIKLMANELKSYCREDLIGVVLHTGAFHALPDGEAGGHAVVDLAKKLLFTDADRKFLEAKHLKINFD